MICALTQRHLKPGAYDDFRKAWEGDAGSPPAGWKVFHVRNTEDPDDVISFGLFDGSLEDVRKQQQEMDYSEMRAQTDQFVESTGADGLYEVVEQLES